jgi:hypothetical protein
MTAAARSIYAFGIYLIVLGAILAGSPNTLLTLLGVPATTEPWIHVLGITVMAIGMLDAASARAEQTGFFRASVWVRVFVFVGFIVFTLLKIAPPILLAFGAVDLAGAAWTFIALRQTSAGPSRPLSS